LVAVLESSKPEKFSSPSSAIALTTWSIYHIWQLQSDWICQISSRVEVRWYKVCRPVQSHPWWGIFAG